MRFQADVIIDETRRKSLTDENEYFKYEMKKLALSLGEKILEEASTTDKQYLLRNRMTGEEHYSDSCPWTTDKYVVVWTRYRVTTNAYRD